MNRYKVYGGVRYSSREMIDVSERDIYLVCVYELEDLQNDTVTYFCFEENGKVEYKKYDILFASTNKNVTLIFTRELLIVVKKVNK